MLYALVFMLVGAVLAVVTQQYYFSQIGQIKAGGPEDPLEAWSEYGYIGWRYNTSHYAIRNMSTNMVQIFGTNATTVINTGLQYGNVMLKGKPNPQYVISGEIHLNKTRTYLMGESTEVTLNATSNLGSGDAVIQVDASYCHVSNLRIDCNKHADYGVQVYGSGEPDYGGAANVIYNVEVFDAAKDGIIQNYPTQKTGNKYLWCRIKNATRYGIYLGDNHSDNWITSCIVKQPAYEGTYAGIGLDEGGNQILDNHIWGCDYGIDLAPNKTIVGCSFVGNYIESNRYHNMKADGHSVWECTWTGNEFWRSGLTGEPANTYYDFWINLTGTYRVQANTFTGNNFRGNTKTKAAINATDWRFTYNTLVGNTFYQYDEIPLQFAAGTYNTVEGNYGFRTRDCGQVTVAYGEWVPHHLYTTPTSIVVTPLFTEWQDKTFTVAVIDKNETHFRVAPRWTPEYNITSGNAQVHHNDWVKHDLSVVPDSILVTGRVTWYGGEPFVLAVLDQNTTHFQVGCRWVNGTTITATDAIAIFWLAIDDWYETKIETDDIYIYWIAVYEPWG